MAQDQYISIRRFIVRHIQDQDFGEDDGLPGRVLIQLCLEHFYPDLEDPEAVRTEKKSIESAIRRMVEASMLQPVIKNQKIVFRLQPFFNIKDRMNPTASQPTENPQSTQEALEALAKETSPDVEDQDMDEEVDDDELDQQLAQQLDESMNQVEDEAEEEVDMQAERPQSGSVQKPVDNGEEQQQLLREEEVAYSLKGTHHQDDADEDTGDPAAPHLENQATDTIEDGTRRQQEAHEAARIEATSEEAPKRPQEVDVDYLLCTGHAEAYAELTRGAAPMPREQEEDEQEDEDPIITPGRKRRRLLEIAVSESSSSFDAISPGNYPYSTPRRRMIRQGTPFSASRRRSVPTGKYNSPSKQRSPRHMEDRIVKEERIDSSPRWLKEAVNELRLENPGTSIITENGIVKCLDCNGKPFKPAANQSLHGVMTHLRSKAHQTNLTRRQEKLGPSDCYFPTIIPAIDFNLAQPPLMVYANQRQQPPHNLTSAANVFVKALEDETHRTEIRTTLMEHRVLDIQKQTKEQQERIETLLEAFESQRVEQQKLVSGLLASTEDKQKQLSQDVIDRVQSVEEKSKNQLQEMENRMTASQEESTTMIEDMSTKLARSDQRNYNDIQDITERVKESQEAFEERTSQLSEEIKNLKDINEGQNVVIQETEIQLIEKTKQFQEIVKAQNDKIQALQSQVGESTQEAKKYKKTAESQSNEVHNLRAKIDESTDQIKASKEIINSQKKTLNDLDLRLAEKTKSLTKRLEAQEETIFDLESQCQLLRDTREQHEKAIADQMEAHVRQTEKQITGIKKEYTKQAGQLKKLEQTNADQQKAIQSLVSWVHKFQKVHTERSKELDRREADRQKFEQNMSTQFQILDDTNKEQQESIEAFEAFIPSIMEDFNGLRKYVKETQRQVTTKTVASLVKTRASN